VAPPVLWRVVPVCGAARLGVGGRRCLQCPSSSCAAPLVIVNRIFKNARPSARAVHCYHDARCVRCLSQRPAVTPVHGTVQPCACLLPVCLPQAVSLPAPLCVYSSTSLPSVQSSDEQAWSSWLRRVLHTDEVPGSIPGACNRKGFPPLFFSFFLACATRPPTTVRSILTAILGARVQSLTSNNAPNSCANYPAPKAQSQSSLSIRRLSEYALFKDCFYVEFSSQVFAMWYHQYLRGG
jgi:hypothetical protein